MRKYPLIPGSTGAFLVDTQFALHGEPNNEVYETEEGATQFGEFLFEVR